MLYLLSYLSPYDCPQGSTCPDLVVDFQMRLSCLPSWTYQSLSGMDTPFVLTSCCQSTWITHCFFPKIHIICLLCTRHCNRQRDGTVFIDFILSGHRIPWYKLSLCLTVLPFLQLSFAGTICSYLSSGRPHSCHPPYAAPWRLF